jgi:hypothetical protein
MILDEWLTYEQKVFLAMMAGGLWIFFRTSDCYQMIPRLHVIPVLFVVGWIYLNYYDPLFLPLGLAVLIAYAVLSTKPRT